MFDFIKRWKYPAGKYKTVDGLENRKGETLDELFIRRGHLIIEKIHASYPTLSYDVYMALSNTGNVRRLSGEPKDGIGAVYDAEANTLTLYRLIK